MLTSPPSLPLLSHKHAIVCRARKVRMAKGNRDAENIHPYHARVCWWGTWVVKERAGETHPGKHDANGLESLCSRGRHNGNVWEVK